MAIHYVAGDLFVDEHGVQAFAHGCNCIGSMGAGIAVVFRERYPDMYQEYRRRCKAQPRRFCSRAAAAGCGQSRSSGMWPEPQQRDVARAGERGIMDLDHDPPAALLLPDVHGHKRHAEVHGGQTGQVKYGTFLICGECRSRAPWRGTRTPSRSSPHA